MKPILNTLRRKMLGLSYAEVDFQRRGFCGASSMMRTRLETAGRAFIDGYNFGLECGSISELLPLLDSITPELQGFAYEGAAMSLELLDIIMPWTNRRVAALLRQSGGKQKYTIHVGIGWAWARLPFGFRRRQSKLDPVLGWLALDGWGFHEGFFHWGKYQSGQVPRRFVGYETRAFDQGLGRSLWFVKGGNLELIADAISRFSSNRQADLWSGIGLAATYAGILSQEDLHRLCELSGDHSTNLAQGSAFASKARLNAGSSSEYTELASSILCGLPATESAKLTDEALKNFPMAGTEPTYEVWRKRISQHFASATLIHNS